MFNPREEDGPIFRLAVITILVFIVAVQAYAYSLKEGEVEAVLKSSHSLQEEIKTQETIIETLKLEIDRREGILNSQTVPVEEPSNEEIVSFVTGYNSVPSQTWGNPCQSATGDMICGRDDVVACPSSLELGTVVEIEGNSYECLDRTAEKFNGRFDIFCDKDMECPYEVTGWKTIVVMR